MTIANHKIFRPQSVRLSSINENRVKTAKAAYTTRRIDRDAIYTLLDGEIKPRAGDLLLARVENIGHHKRIELETGRRAPLFPGDEVMVCYGNRYAPDQFEAEVPEDLGACHLVAAGGIASECLSHHGKISMPTQLQPLGLLGDADGRPLNMVDWALAPAAVDAPSPLVIAVVGTSMNAGKTTTAAYLIKGLSRAGMKVGAAKITGTGAGGDRWLMQDAGAFEVVDFTDAGFATTYRTSIQELEGIQSRLMNHLHGNGAEAIVLEIADGLFQQETAALLASARFRSNIDAVFFAAGDAMGASGGVEWLRQHNLPVMGISGCVSASPLAAREAGMASGLPVFGLDQLASADIAEQIFDRDIDWTDMAAKVG